MATPLGAPPETHPTVGSELKKLREGRGLSLRQIAALAAVNVSCVSRWEAGQRLPAIPELDATLAALEASGTQKREVLRLINAPRAVVKLRDLDTTGTETVACGGGGDLLWAMRKRRGWTQIETARSAGFEQSQIARWERGDAWPDAKKLHMLCWTLSAQPEEVEALTRITDADHQGRQRLLGANIESDSASWSAQTWLNHVNTLLRYPPPKTLADLVHIGIEQRLAQLASVQPFAVQLLPDVYAAHARHWFFHKRPELAAHWAARGMTFLRQGKNEIVRRPDAKQLWFGNILILAALQTKQTGQKRRPGLRRAAKMLRDWLPGLRFGANEKSEISSHYAWGQMTLAETLSQLGQESEALALGEKAYREAASIRPSEGYLRGRDYANLLRKVGRPERAVDVLSQSQTLLGWKSARPEIVARHALIEAQCLVALNDTANAEEKAREAEQLIVSHNLWHLQDELRQVTSG